MAKPTLISLYSGCGGSALGFQDAGFEIKYMNDNNSDAYRTLLENFQKRSANPEIEIVHGEDIKDVFVSLLSIISDFVFSLLVSLYIVIVSEIPLISFSPIF